MPDGLEIIKAAIDDLKNTEIYVTISCIKGIITSLRC